MAAADAERRKAAILYAELRNFTRLSEVLPPEKVLELANDFFSFCAMAITANKGKVLSVQNDALIAAFAAAHPRRRSHPAARLHEAAGHGAALRRGGGGPAAGDRQAPADPGLRHRAQH